MSAVDHLISYAPNNKSEIFNVGGNYSASIRELAHLIQERFKKNFGISLMLFIPDGEKNELVLSFSYKIDRLLSTDFKFEGNLESDIDELLVFCKNSFIQVN